MLVTIVIGLILVAMVTSITRIYLKNKAKALSEEIENIPAYRVESDYEQTSGRLTGPSSSTNIDIPTNLSNSFQKK